MWPCMHIAVQIQHDIVALPIVIITIYGHITLDSTPSPQVQREIIEKCVASEGKIKVDTSLVYCHYRSAPITQCDWCLMDYMW
jgi:hypothetical protein